jgi:hypothetical protein
MSLIITKVKKYARKKRKENKTTGWPTVLEDIHRDISQLLEFARIVDRKIERGEPWPGTQSADQNSESCHSV